MGREVRRVPKDWEHPKRANGRYQPLFGYSFSKCLDDWERNKIKWDEGLMDDYKGGWKEKTEDALSCESFENWYGKKPIQSDYMPEWPEKERTHYQMYEDTTEGTPISPVMESPEELAQWLVDNNASAFADETATYEGWLNVCKGKPAFDLVVFPETKQMLNGVDATRLKERE